MGNTDSTTEYLPDSLQNVCDDILQCVEARSKIGLLEADYVFPSISDQLWNWLFPKAKPTHTFSFDSYASYVENDPRIGLFANEMIRTVNRMTISEKDANHTTSLIIDDLADALKNQNVPGLWQYYGSYRDGLCCTSSDIDLYYPLDGPYYTDGYLGGILRSLGLLKDHKNDIDPIPKRIERLLRQSPLFDRVFYIETAKVSVIKLVHLQTRKNVDISFSQTSVMNTELMKFLIHLDENVKYLTLYLKHLLLQHNLHGTNKITTTILFWLVVYFMQLAGLLPSVLKLRRVAKNKSYFDDWDCSVPGKTDESAYSRNNGILFLLLRNFFKFYQDYDFLKAVICPLVGHDIPIYQFKNLQLPSTPFSVYLTKVRNGQINGFPISFINLQDPTLLHNNLAKQTNESTINQFKILCHLAYEGLSDSSLKNLKKPLTDYLPTNLYVWDRWHHNFVQFTSLRLNFHDIREDNTLKLFGHRYALSVIRAMMIDVFQFQCDYIVPMNGDRKPNDSVSCFYLEFSADYNTRRNCFIRRILKLANKPADISQQSLSVYMLCEIDKSRRYAKITLQSDLYLYNFLKTYMNRILSCMFKHGDVAVD